ncbi:MAG TPA: hypothetical protein VFB29_05125 [Pseudolabrys sp.]|nr:hypothetical protein [Pseudolabrys sp.]
MALATMGYWESLDEEHLAQQRRLPWHRRDIVVYPVSFLTIICFMFQFVYVLKALGRWLLSLR